MDGKCWLELREPGSVPTLKGPFRSATIARTLREFFDARPAAFVTVITIDGMGPLLQDGPECLMMADGRSAKRAKRHIATSNAAHAQAQNRA